LSDHSAINIVISNAVSNDSSTSNENTYRASVNWLKTSDYDIWRYKITVNNYLDKLEPNNSIAQCKNFTCSDAEHIVQIEQYQNVSFVISNFSRSTIN